MMATQWILGLRMMPGQAWDGLAGWGDGAWVRVAHFFVVAVMGNQPRGYGATAARLTPDQKVGTSNLSGLIFDSLALCNYHGLDSDLSGLGKQLINCLINELVKYFPHDLIH